MRLFQTGLVSVPQVDKFPKLPLPVIKPTMERYLDAIKAVVNDEEYKRTQDKVQGE